MEQHRHRRGHSTNPAAAILRPACGIIGAAPMRGAVGMRSLWKSLAVRWLGGRASEALVGEITPLELLLSEAAPTAPTFAVRRLAAVSPRALLPQQPPAALHGVAAADDPATPAPVAPEQRARRSAAARLPPRASLAISPVDAGRAAGQDAAIFAVAARGRTAARRRAAGKDERMSSQEDGARRAQPAPRRFFERVRDYFSPHEIVDTSPKIADEVKYTTCYMCACRCGIKVHLKDGAIRYIEGNRDHPVNRGVICGKGASGIMQQHSPAKLRKPLRRVGERGAGAFREIEWDEA